MPDLYYAPEKHGLDLVGEIEWSSGFYEFNITAVWRDKEGNLYYADDSGCSCPSPFEDWGSINDLTKTTSAELQNYLELQNSSKYQDDRSMEIANLMERVVNGKASD